MSYHSPPMDSGYASPSGYESGGANSKIGEIFSGLADPKKAYNVAKTAGKKALYSAAAPVLMWRSDKDTVNHAISDISEQVSQMQDLSYTDQMDTVASMVASYAGRSFANDRAIRKGLVQEGIAEKASDIEYQDTKKVMGVSLYNYDENESFLKNVTGQITEKKALPRDVFTTSLVYGSIAASGGAAGVWGFTQMRTMYSGGFGGAAQATEEYGAVKSEAGKRVKDQAASIGEAFAYAVPLGGARLAQTGLQHLSAKTDSEKVQQLCEIGEILSDHLVTGTIMAGAYQNGWGEFLNTSSGVAHAKDIEMDLRDPDKNPPRAPGVNLNHNSTADQNSTVSQDNNTDVEYKKEKSEGNERDFEALKEKAEAGKPITLEFQYGETLAGIVSDLKTDDADLEDTLQTLSDNHDNIKDGGSTIYAGTSVTLDSDDLAALGYNSTDGAEKSMGELPQKLANQGFHTTDDGQVVKEVESGDTLWSIVNDAYRPGYEHQHEDVNNDMAKANVLSVIHNISATDGSEVMKVPDSLEQARNEKAFSDPEQYQIQKGGELVFDNKVLSALGYENFADSYFDEQESEASDSILPEKLARLGFTYEDGQVFKEAERGDSLWEIVTDAYGRGVKHDHPLVENTMAKANVEQAIHRISTTAGSEVTNVPGNAEMARENNAFRDPSKYSIDEGAKLVFDNHTLSALGYEDFVNRHMDEAPEKQAKAKGPSIYHSDTAVPGSPLAFGIQNAGDISSVDVVSYSEGGDVVDRVSVDVDENKLAYTGNKNLDFAAALLTEYTPSAQFGESMTDNRLNLGLDGKVRFVAYDANDKPVQMRHINPVAEGQQANMEVPGQISLYWNTLIHSNPGPLTPGELADKHEDLSYGESYLFGVTRSGEAATHHLKNTALDLTGGAHQISPDGEKIEYGREGFLESAVKGVGFTLGSGLALLGHTLEADPGEGWNKMTEYGGKGLSSLFMGLPMSAGHTFENLGFTVLDIGQTGVNAGTGWVHPHAVDQTTSILFDHVGQGGLDLITDAAFGEAWFRSHEIEPTKVLDNPAETVPFLNYAIEARGVDTSLVGADNFKPSEVTDGMLTDTYRSGHDGAVRDHVATSTTQKVMDMATAVGFDIWLYDQLNNDDGDGGDGDNGGDGGDEPDLGGGQDGGDDVTGGGQGPSLEGGQTGGNDVTGGPSLQGGQ